MSKHDCKRMIPLDLKKIPYETDARESQGVYKKKYHMKTSNGAK